MKRLTNLFAGRITRRQFLLGMIVVLAGFALVTFLMLALAGNVDGPAVGAVALVVTLVTWVMAIILVFSLTVRRIHDLGRSGWYALLLLVSPINVAGLLILSVEKGQAADNEHGPAPDSRRSVLAALTNDESSASQPLA